VLTIAKSASLLTDWVRSEARLLLGRCLKARTHQAERELQISQERKCNRRRFLGVAAMSIVGAELGMIGSANAQSTKAKPAEVLNVKLGTNTPFASLPSSKSVPVISFAWSCTRWDAAQGS
jgi:hypothetical protein